MGHIIDYDPNLETIIIKVDFLSIENQRILEDLFKNKSEFSFFFRKPFRQSKTYMQLRKYFRLLKQILRKQDIYPDSEVVRALDIEIKKSILPCKKLEFQGKIIPIVPTKSELDIEVMGYLIKEVMDRYDVD
jgi:hypothetical protein